MPRSRLLFREFRLLQRRTDQIPTSTLNPVINWEQGGNFFIDINTDTTISFENTYDSHTVVLVVKNTSTSTRTLTLPSAVKKSENFEGTLDGLTTSIFTFVQTDGIIYVAEVIGY